MNGLPRPVSFAWLRRLPLLLLLLLACMPRFTGATTYRALSVAEVFLSAELAYTGTVAAVTSEMRDGRPWTRVTVALSELLKALEDEAAGSDGQPGGSDGNQQGQLSIWLLGGEGEDGSRLLVAGAPEFQQGEQVLVAAYREESLASSLVGYRQGLWRLSELGFVDDDGLYLELTDSLALNRSALPSDAPAVLDAIRRLLAGEPSGEASAAGDLPAPAEAGAAGDTPADAAGQAPETDQPARPQAGAEPDTAAGEAGGVGARGAEADPAPTETAVISLVYDVNDSGGPLLLSDQVARAGAAWAEAASGRLALSRDAAAANRFAYGPATLFGPDVLSLTLRWSPASGSAARPPGAPAPAFEVLVSPTAGLMVGAALRHEFGVLLGLTAQPAGMMAMALSDPGLQPGAAETAQLGDLGRFGREDINHDGAVDFYDLIELAAQYGRNGVNLTGDLNGDGRVDDVDIERLGQAYQFAEPRQDAAEQP